MSKDDISIGSINLSDDDSDTSDTDMSNVSVKKDIPKGEGIEKKTIKTKIIKKQRNQGIYSVNVFTRKIYLSFQEIGSNITQIIEEKLKQDLEGKCVEEGFIKTGSIRVIQYTSGNISGNNIVFTVVFECLLCFPVEGMKFKVVVKEVTLAGVRAETKEKQSPVDVFVARDHNFDNKRFNSIREGDIITIRVIGQRYEINDEKISVIADVTYVEKAPLVIKK